MNPFSNKLAKLNYKTIMTQENFHFEKEKNCNLIRDSLFLINENRKIEY